jgi:hypothetical protein
MKTAVCDKLGIEIPIVQAPIPPPRAVLSRLNWRCCLQWRLFWNYFLVAC